MPCQTTSHPILIVPRRKIWENIRINPPAVEAGVNFDVIVDAASLLTAKN
jgi:hypothetical protein